MFRLLQTVLFKTNSVFDALFACFDETIDFYQWIKPWKGYIIVARMQKKYRGELKNFFTKEKRLEVMH